MRLELRRSALPPRPSAAFVAAIAARHGAERSAWPAAERVLRFDARASIVTHVRQLFAVLFSPHVQVSIASELRALLPAPGRPAPDSSGAAGAPAAPVAAMRTLRHEVLTARLLERASRHSTFDVLETTRVLRAVEQENHPRRPAGTAPAEPRRASARVFARPVAAMRAAPLAAREADRQATASLRGDTVAPPASHPLSAAVDINRLTRDVMRGIDERIVAHRERMGRS